MLGMPSDSVMKAEVRSYAKSIFLEQKIIHQLGFEFPRESVANCAICALWNVSLLLRIVFNLLQSAN